MLSNRPIQDREPASSGNGESSGNGTFAPPVISVPKGGGAIHGIGEKFGVNPVTGTGSMAMPIATSRGRSGFGPQLSLSYDSGSGNGPFGFGWGLSLPSIARKTDKGLPQYRDTEESDVFILSGSEDLVPLQIESGGSWQRHAGPRTVNGVDYAVRRYRPRIEGLFARIERWCEKANPENIFWRSISRDNITTWYGKTAESRVADPADPARIFSWRICESYDDKGNAVLYQYKPEDSAGVAAGLANERNRTPASRSAGRYLKRIKYGNRTPRQPNEDLAARTDWLFETVFDYGEHYAENAQGQPTSVLLDDRTRPWSIRQDPFSNYRAAFEVRTYRLCQRVLMFHHFPDELGAADCLVRATEFGYAPGPVASFITRVVQSGYVRRSDGSYFKKSLQPLEFAYSQAVVNDEVRDVDPDSIENLPAGADGTQYRWLDLDGEGLQSVLTEEEDGWYYKRNSSPLSFTVSNGKPAASAQFDALTEVATLPSFAETTALQHQFLDLGGDGQLDCVVLEGLVPGLFERTEDYDWDTFKPLRSLPNLNWREPNLRFFDVTGDGRADVVITEDDALTWYPSLGEGGFGRAIRIPTPRDEEKGPVAVFADAEQAIFVADMSGDGLCDIVRIRNGEISYWPNLGYGQFGAKVTMDGAPWFDAPDLFDQSRIRLADIDGSGTTDLIYLAVGGVRLYFNQSGNQWSAAQKLAVFPQVDNLAAIQAVDLLGNGTACLVWASPLPGDARRPMRYVDLMGGEKPHLLIAMANNLGAETRIQYAPSTKFYLADKLAGRPWITRLPFPVHVVERIETLDRISSNRFVTRSAYHHGHFDGVEREFRGFGMVEQWDTEEFAALDADQQLAPATNIDASSHVPPVLTRTWFHTGVFMDRLHVSNYFAGLINAADTGEYYREPGLNDAEAKRLLLDDSLLPPGLTADEEREACRALKGLMLRQEVYAFDGTDKEPHPYSVTEQNFAVALLQPQNGNPHAVFFPHARESLAYHYERNPADPRVAHGLTLEVDGFGNVLKSAQAAYARRQPDASLEARDQRKQAELHVTYAESPVTNAIDLPDACRTPLPCESRTYELTGLDLSPSSVRFGFDQLAAAAAAAAAISYEQSATPGLLQKRLLKHARTLYRADDLSGPLPLGQLQSLALPFESYKLAFTPGLLTAVYGARVTDAILAGNGGYVHSEGDTQWWIPSGRVFLSPGATDDASTELAAARLHFFLPRRYRDPFGATGSVAYDAYDLLVQETRDALGNAVTAGERDTAGTIVASGNDYRVLQPHLVTDPNRNRAAASFDALGMVVGTAVMGKRDETPRRGDLLDGFEPDLSDAVVASHLSDPFVDPGSILARATTRLVYDLFGYFRTRTQPNPAPNVVYAVVRETHDADLAAGEQTRFQHNFSYSDGFGREIQKKVQAEPGPTTDGGPTVSPRWVGSGWTIFNNKGKPVRQFEPFFSATQAFQSDVRVGVSPVIFYDPAGRTVATLHPDHTWQKVLFDPWRQETWDVNDTVLVADPKLDPDVGDFFRRLPEPDYLPTWYAQRQSGAAAHEQDAAAKAATHAATPAVAHADAVGRMFLSIAHNKFVRNAATVEENYTTRVEFDIEGKQRAVADSNDRIVERCDYDIAGKHIHQTSMEAGERWMLNDVSAKPIHAWDSRDHELRTAYDPLRRPTDSFLREGTGPELLIGRMVYGEGRTDPEAANLRGKVVQLCDQAGVVASDDYDFKGNLRTSRRQLAQNYKTTLDWSASPALEQETFASSSTFDALNRPTSLTTPDQSVYRPTHNQANLLEKVDVNLRGAQAATPFVTNIDYDAKGRRALIEYDNGTRTDYAYDRLSLRLRGLRTTRASDGAVLQDLSYTCDPTGNITQIRDAAQQTIYFRNAVVTPDNDYTYDAVYRLIMAQGREHIGQVSQPQTSWDDQFRVHLFPAPTDGQALRRYSEEYQYDPVGNFLQVIHQAPMPQPPSGNWTRTYAYNEPSLVEPGKRSNRLSTTTVGANPPEAYTYDAHGNTTSMPHLTLMRWDFKDRLSATARQAVTDGTPEITYYVYDASGQRVRKITERQNGTRKDEHIYLGGCERFLAYDSTGTGITLARETLHVMDDKQRVAIVETRTQGSEPDLPPQLVRYQFGNHLGSASLELDEAGQVISYEEYYPYGNTSYQAGRSAAEVGLKRYRYLGKERDEESGFNHHGARYYAPWLGRWASCDPSGLKDAPNLYQFTRGNPVIFVDSTGRDSEIKWEDSHWTYTDEQGDIWNYVVTYGWKQKIELESEWEEDGGYKLDMWSFWLIKKAEPIKKQGLRAVSRSEWTVVDERWIKSTTEVISVEGTAPEEHHGLLSRAWSAGKTAAGIAFDLWSPTGKLKYVKYGIQFYRSYRENGSFWGAAKDLTVNAVVDKVTDAVFGGPTAGKKNAGRRSGGGGGGGSGGGGGGAGGGTGGGAALGGGGGGNRYFVHSGPVAGLDDIVAHGVGPVSTVTKHHPLGSFFTIEATPKPGLFGGVAGAIEAHIGASHFGARYSGQGPIGVVVGVLPSQVVTQMGRGVRTGTLTRALDETVFYPSTFQQFNDNVTWFRLQARF
jgi:RHS repeat-associated protein